MAGLRRSPCACEIGHSERFASPAELCGYTGLCPRVIQSGAGDRRGPVSKHGPRYPGWGLFEAAPNACQHPLYTERYQRTKRRLGRQRGPKLAQIELSRKPTEAIWHMPTRNQRFAAAGAAVLLAARRPSIELRRRNEPPNQPDPHAAGAIQTSAQLATPTPPPGPDTTKPTPHSTPRPIS